MSQELTETPQIALSTTQGYENSGGTEASSHTTTIDTADEALASKLDDSKVASDVPNKPVAVGDQEKASEDEERAKNATKVEDTKNTKEVDSNVAKAISELVKDLGAWKKTFPPTLVDDIDKLEKLAGVSAKESVPYKFEVKKGTMEDWTQASFVFERESPPILQAYYRKANLERPREADQRTTDQEDTHSHQIVSDSKNLQRIQINSAILLTEMESIASITLSFQPVFIAPPYKLIIQFLPAIKSRLLTLKNELNNLPSATVATSEATTQTSSEGEAKIVAPAPDNSSSKEASQNKLEDRISHLECLSTFAEEELKDILDLRASIKTGDLDEIAFEDLWHLFEPGDLIYSESSGRPQLYKVYSTTGGQISRCKPEPTGSEYIEGYGSTRWVPAPPPGGYEEEEIDMMGRDASSGIGTWTPFKVDCYTLGYDGVKYGAVDALLKMKYYSGKRKISKLKMFPIKFHPEKEKILKQMTERGRKYLSCGGHKSYDGKTVPLKRGIATYEIDGDIYIDSEAYYQMFPSQKPKLSQLLKSNSDETEALEIIVGGRFSRRLADHEVDVWRSEAFIAKNRTSVENMGLSDILSADESLQLLPSHIMGWAFRDRTWYWLNIDLIANIDKDLLDDQKSGFDDLVIPQKYSDLLVALVENHASGLQRKRKKLEGAALDYIPTQMDLVRGKGQGLIILLHGPPGSGKTSTAETIAAYTGRPLYSLTCGDIGLEPSEVEHNLQVHTKNADKWGCVLLLDEADVFLMQRDWQNTKRNALVSVFLRQLEYYSGILFLTTNRPGVIDEAFKSRIHISLRYPAINLDMTIRMWTNLLNRIERDNEKSKVKVIFDRKKLLTYAEKHFNRSQAKGIAWNGRQIRNALHTALAMAYYDRVVKLRDNGMTEADAVASGKEKYMTVKLNRSHLESIANTAREFEEYIDALRGRDADRARDGYLRDDFYDAHGHTESAWAQKPYPQSTSARSSNYTERVGQDFPRQKLREGKSKQYRKGAQEEPIVESKEEEDEDSEDSSSSEDSSGS